MASKQLSEEQNDYLRNLPFSIEFYMSGKFIRMFHASPRVYMKEFNHTLQREERISMFENNMIDGKYRREKTRCRLLR